MKTSLSVISKCMLLCMLILLVQQSAFSQISFVNSGQQLGINTGSGQGQYSATTGDLDNDGAIDIVAANWIGLIDVHLNVLQGGTMSSYQIPGFSQTWSSLALADIDKDGDLDLLAGFEASANGGLMIFKNDGAGVFSNMPQPNLIGANKSANTVAVGDVDGDGDIDALIGSRWTTVPTILLNNGSGVFTPGQNFSVGMMCIGSALIDVDADGDLDALLGNSGSIILYKNNGQGVFTQFSNNMTGYKPASKQYDLDGDGDLDLVITYNGNFNVYKNDGTGNFTLAQSVTHAGLNPWGKVAVGDLDGDGDKDVYATALGSSDPDAVFANNGAGSFCKAPVANLNVLQSTEAEIADFNGDGKQDVFVPNLQPDFDAIYFNTSTGPFLSPSVTASSNSPVTPGSNVNLSATGSFTTWSWSGPNAFSSNLQNPIITSANTATSGTYTITATNAGGCVAKASTIVAVTSPATALNFDGVNDYVHIANPFRAFNKEITVEFWFKPSTANLPFGTIIGQSTADVDAMSTNVWIMHPETNGNMTFYVNDGGTWRASAQFPIIANEWHHIAGTASASGVKVYVDGVQQGTTTPGISGTIQFNSASVIQIGKDVRWNNRFGNESIDEVKIWSRALCQAEIQNNMNCELASPTTQTGLQEYYRFNQGFVNADNSSVSTVNDLSGNGRNGVLTNMALTGATSNWVTGMTLGSCSVFNGASPITGNTTICIGGNTALSNVNAGTWNSSNTAVATVNASGVVTGLTAGTTTISFTNASGTCFGVATTTVTVNANPTININSSSPSIAAGASTNLSTASNMVGYWKFNDSFGTTVSDASGNNLTGTFVGGISWVTNRPFSNAGTQVSNNGTGYISVNDNPAFTAMQNAFTMEAWVYQTDNTNNTIVDKGNYNFLFEINPNGQPGLGFYNPTADGWSYSTTAIPTNTWVHVAVSWDGATKTLKFYKNGVLTDSFVRPNGLLFDNGPMNIGRQSPSTCACNMMNGTIDELRIWNVVKSASEISANMTKSLNVSSSASFVWSPATGLNTTSGSSVIATPSSTTTYTATATSAAGCVTTGTTTVTVKQNLPALITASGTTTLCANGSVTLTASAGGNALSLTGTNYLQNSNFALPQGNLPRTLEAWIKTTQTSTGVIANYGQTVANQRFGLLMVGGKLYFVGEGNDLTGNITINDGNWHHVAVSFDGATIRLYVDGVADLTKATTLNTTGATIRIGQRAVGDGLNELFIGLIDEVKIWNVAKTASEIANNKNSISTFNAPNLVSYYRMEEVTGATITPDLAANLNGTLIGSPGFVASTAPIDYSSYSWSNGATAKSISVSNAGNYTVTGVLPDGSSSSASAATNVTLVTINDQTVTASPNAICGSGSSIITVGATQNGFSYSLRDNSNNAIVAGPIVGTGASINFNTGNLTSSKTYNVLAQTAVSGALSFDGLNKFVDLPYTTGTLGLAGNSFTVSAWVYRTNNNTNDQEILGNINGCNLHLLIRGNKPYLGFCGNDLAGNTLINANQWYHIAFVYNASTFTQSIYVNGVLDATQSGHNVLSNDGTGLRIGGYGAAGNAQGKFAGTIDELQIWNFARTASQVSTGINNALTGTESGLIAYYNFDQATGTSVSDLSNHHYNGTLNANMSNADWTTGSPTVVSGCSLQMSQTATVVVNTLPVATISVSGPTSVCLGSSVVLLSNRGFGSTCQWYKNNLLISGATSTSYTATSSGSYTVVITNANGCVSNPSNPVVVTIQDIIKPFFSSAGSITTATNAQGQVLATSAQGAVVTYNAPVGADNCTVVSNVLTAGLASGSVFPIGTTTVTYTVTDGAGQTETSSFDVVVSGLAPSLIAPANITVNNDEGQCGAIVSFAATGSVGIPASTITYTEDGQSVVSGQTFSIGVHNITATATNAVGTSSVNFTITVIDNQVPVITAPANISVIATSAAGAMVTYVAPVGTDNCSSNTVMIAGYASGSNFPIGTTTVTYTVTDASGNTASASFTVTVVGVAPVIVVPENITQNNDAGQCGASVSFAATETTAIPASTIVYTEDGQTIESGHFFSVGTHTITATATNAVGSSSGTFTITILDTVAPNLTVPANINVFTDNNVCGAVVSFAATASDNCSPASISYSHNPGTVFPVGITTVTVTASDPSGNATVLTFTVSVTDKQAPVALAKNITVGLSAVGGTVSISAADVNNGSNDACGIASMTVMPSSFSCANIGANTVTLTVTDNNGNVSTTTAIVTVVDDKGPVPTAVLPVISGQCSVKLVIASSNGAYNSNKKDHDDDDHENNGATVITAPTAMDNCSGLIKGITTDPLVYNNQGTYIIHWKFVDARGNVTIQEQIVIVKDTQAPRPKYASLPTITGQCSVSIVNTNNSDDDGDHEGREGDDHDGDDDHDHYDEHQRGAPWAKDNCSGWIRGTTTDPLTYTTQGTYIIHWTFNDGHGNISTQNQTVIVKDITKPKIKAPNDKTVTCGSNTAPAAMGMATATDNCSVPVISYTDVNSGTQIVRTWRATDAAGNFSTDVQVIKLSTAFSGTVVSVPTSTVYTGGEVNNLYLGYGAQGTALTVTGLPSSGAPYTYSWSGVATNRLSATNTGAPVFSPIAGGVYTFTVTMTNKNGCSNTASISICVTDIRVPGSNGALVYVCHKGSGKTGGTKTLEVPVAQVASHIQAGSCGGKNDRLGSCDQNPCNSGNDRSAVDPKQLEEPIEVKPELKAAPVVVEELKVVVMPNPTTTYFTIRLESKDKAPVNLRVMDGSGRVIDAKQKMEPNSSFQMGHGYSSGTYYAEFIQGNKRKVIQLIKGRG